MSSALGQRHRRIIVGAGGLVLGGLHQQSPRSELAEREYAAAGSGETCPDPAQPGGGEVAVSQPGHRIGHGDLGQPVDLGVRGAGEPDPGPVTDCAVCAVAAHQVTGGHPVGPFWAVHLCGHRGIVLADPGDLVPAADHGAELPGALAEQPLKPGLG
jgi:hypothetical protein